MVNPLARKRVIGLIAGIVMILVTLLAGVSWVQDPWLQYVKDIYYEIQAQNHSTAASQGPLDSRVGEAVEPKGSAAQ